MQIYLNGKIVPEEEAKVSVFDHGFLYGDGVFEGIRVYDGNVFRLEEHIDRLFESANTIDMDIGMTPQEMIQAILDTIVANKKKDAYIRLVVSRGRGDLGIDPDKCDKPTIVIIVASIALYPEEFYRNGIELVTASLRRIPMSSLDPRIKSLNYLNNILAKIEGKQAGCVEALMLNQAGLVAECTADNIFMVKGNVLRTPDVLQGALAGITRQAVLDLAEEMGMETVRRKVGLHDLYNADEVFLTGTGAEVVPVIKIDGRQIGIGKPGAKTHALLEAFRKLRTEDGVKVDYDKVPELTGA
jgi:branched-chain amino acid aminotransferase